MQWEARRRSGANGRAGAGDDCAAHPATIAAMRVGDGSPWHISGSAGRRDADRGERAKFARRSAS